MKLLRPDWQVSSRVKALMTTRSGGVSSGPYASLNLGDHVGDDPEAVAWNRRIIRALLPSEPVWLQQVHGLDVLEDDGLDLGARADAIVTRTPGRVCVIMTADCLPVLLCDAQGTVVGAAHAGWRSLCGGIIERTVARMGVSPEDVTAWLGAAIGPEAFEVGDEVRAQFLSADPGATVAFRPSGAGKWLADMYELACQRLHRAGVHRVVGERLCTSGAPAEFFSYRRDGVTGRMASLIWLGD